MMFRLPFKCFAINEQCFSFYVSVLIFIHFSITENKQTSIEALPNELIVRLLETMDENSKRNFRLTSRRNRDAYDHAVSRRLRDEKFVKNGGQDTAECWMCENSCVYTKGEVVIMHECICPSTAPSPLQDIADVMKQTEQYENLMNLFLNQNVSFVKNFDLIFDRLSTLGK